MSNFKYRTRRLLAWWSGLILLIAGGLVTKDIMRPTLSPDDKVRYRVIPGKDLELHLFKSRRPIPVSGVPAILFFHGGAWQYGTPTQFYPQCKFFSEHGITCVSAAYRIMSVHSTDVRTALEDARAALDYLQDNARSLGIDPSRIVVSGGSAGGHLAAALGVGLPKTQHQGVFSKRRPRALLLYNPMLDLSPGRPDHHLVADYWEEISPYHHIDDQVPPAIILLGTQDREVPVTTAQSFCDRMKARIEKLILYEGAQHGFFNSHIEDGKYFNLTNQVIMQFIQALDL
jgi:acetyl esterase